MCHWSSRDYERRLRADPGRSFFQVLRDLFRRNRRPQAEAPEVGAEVIPLRAERLRKPHAPGRERADAA
jgi:hypothetical protein